MTSAFKKLKETNTLTNQFLKDAEQVTKEIGNGADFIRSKGITLQEWMSSDEFYEHLNTVGTFQTARVTSSLAEALVEQDLITWEQAQDALPRALEIGRLRFEKENEESED